MGIKIVQFRALFRKDWLQMKAEKGKIFHETLIMVGYAVLIGYLLSLGQESESQMGLGYLILILVCPFLFQSATVYIANQMVKDRETKMKETLKIMGCQSWIYAISFLVQRGLWIILPSLVTTISICLWNQSLVGPDKAVLLFLAIWLFGVGLLCVTMLIQNFFKNSHLVTMVLPFLFYVPTGIAMLLILSPTVSQEPIEWIEYLFWFPSFPFTAIIINILDESPENYFTASYALAWICLVVMSPLYYFLHLYIESILPDNYGISKSCCFCLNSCRKQRSAEQYSDENAEIDMKNQPNDIENGVRRMTTQSFDASDPIQLKKVTMKFGDFKAVDDISLSIKENEIMALLGHNGAGKTTAIYMLTGMLQMTSGQASIYGKNVKLEIEEVRKQIGLCQQLDVLFDLVSVKEHLLMALRIRHGKVDPENETAQINDILTRCQLTEHKDKLIKECSGGMKRKLSLGMALIGETKTIILDEPTSGLDVESRQQMWSLIRTLKQSRSIIMSTQHIEEADELADRVCIMSHGRIIGLDKPDEIKRKFGVGYNVFIEIKHQFESQLGEAAQKQVFDRVRAIFFGINDLPGIEESQDTNDKKLIIQVPSAYVHRLADLIRQVESTVLEAQIDIELNSLEDAFIKIAEGDIKAEENKAKEMVQKDFYMSEEDEQKAMQDYFDFEGRQNCCQKIYFITLHRLQLFYRSGVQWVAVLLPLLFVTMMCFISYTITKSQIGDTVDDEKVISIVLKSVFTLFFLIGYCFSAGIPAIIPMVEKKGGLRHMMHLFGLNSFQYFFGMAIADLIIVLIPATFATTGLLIFDQIMIQESAWKFWVVFMFFGCAMNTLSYLFTHIFSDPDTAVKYLSMIYIFGFSLAPFVLSMVISEVTEGDFQKILSFSIFFSPLCTFYIITTNLCYAGNELLEDLTHEIGGTQVDLPMTIGVFSYQIVVIFLMAVLIDNCIRNGYKKRGGADGELPPHLEVHQDVKDHEEQVRQASNLQPNDPNYLQIRAEDLCKTYPKSKNMAVCRNTFGVKQGEVYGLLGPNGAGKSTTFSMMAMQNAITSGNGQMMNHGINQLPLAKLGKFFGICNQENLMWEDMTVDESLNLVASLKGVSGERREVFKRLIMQNLDLTFFKNTLAKNLSGGNKRKLCCAQAIMLNPRVLFLDEPTCGVDPVSRRSLNRMIKKMKMASVLLTTHRMDEAEQLCDKIAIMINGRFVVFGSPNYLKTQYGHGYTISIKQTEEKFHDAAQNIVNQMTELIPSAQLVHSEGQISNIQVAANNPDEAPAAETDIKSLILETRFKIHGVNTENAEGAVSSTLSEVFDKCAQLLQSEAIKDFTLTRTTMGEVFTDFAKFQIDAAAQGEAQQQAN